MGPRPTIYFGPIILKSALFIFKKWAQNRIRLSPKKQIPHLKSQRQYGRPRISTSRSGYDVVGVVKVDEVRVADEVRANHLHRAEAAVIYGGIDRRRTEAILNLDLCQKE